MVNVVEQLDFNDLIADVRVIEQNVQDLDQKFEKRVNEQVIRVLQALAVAAGTSPVGIYHLTHVVKLLEKENNNA